MLEFMRLPTAAVATATAAVAAAVTTVAAAGGHLALDYLKEELGRGLSAEAAGPSFGCLG